MSGRSGIHSEDPGGHAGSASLGIVCRTQHAPRHDESDLTVDY